MNDGRCPIWGTEAQCNPHAPFFYLWNSSRAGGPYIVRQDISNDPVILRQLNPKVKARLTTLLVDYRRLHSEHDFPEITEEMITKAENKPNLSVVERADRLLQYFEQQAPQMGKNILNSYQLSLEGQISSLGGKMENEWCAHSESIDISEFYALCEFLEKKDWLKCQENSGDHYVPIKITPEGYIHLEELKNVNADSSQVFVAMWFGSKEEDKKYTEKVFKEGIEPAINAAGYDPLSINKKEHNNNIVDEIIAEIRRSRCVVADFTHVADLIHKDKETVRGSVYFEAGFAQGLGIDVIFTCKKGIDPHFDIQQRNFIFWKDTDELKEKLLQRIRGTLPIRDSKKTPS